MPLQKQWSILGTPHIHPSERALEPLWEHNREAPRCSDALLGEKKPHFEKGFLLPVLTFQPQIHFWGVPSAAAGAEVLFVSLLPHSAHTDPPWCPVTAQLQLTLLRGVS